MTQEAKTGPWRPPEGPLACNLGAQAVESPERAGKAPWRVRGTPAGPLVSPNKSRREFREGGGSTLPGPDETVRTEKCLVCSVTAHHWVSLGRAGSGKLCGWDCRNHMVKV